MDSNTTLFVTGLDTSATLDEVKLTLRGSWLMLTGKLRAPRLLRSRQSVARPGMRSNRRSLLSAVLESAYLPWSHLDLAGGG